MPAITSNAQPRGFQRCQPRSRQLTITLKQHVNVRMPGFRFRVVNTLDGTHATVKIKRISTRVLDRSKLRRVPQLRELVGDASDGLGRDRFSVLGTVRVRNQYDLPGLLTMPLSFRMSGRAPTVCALRAEHRITRAGQNFCLASGSRPHIEVLPARCQGFRPAFRVHTCLGRATTRSVRSSRFFRRLQSAPSTDKPLQTRTLEDVPIL